MVGFFNENATPENLLVPLEEFTVKVSNFEGDGYVYVRLGLVLKFSKSKDIQVVKTHEAIMRDVINNYLYSLTAEDLNKSSAIYFLREEITLRINKVLSPINASNVFFDNFVVG